MWPHGCNTKRSRPTAEYIETSFPEKYGTQVWYYHNLQFLLLLFEIVITIIVRRSRLRLTTRWHVCWHSRDLYRLIGSSQRPRMLEVGYTQFSSLPQVTETSVLRKLHRRPVVKAVRRRNMVITGPTDGHKIKSKTKSKRGILSRQTNALGCYS